MLSAKVGFDRFVNEASKFAIRGFTVCNYNAWAFFVAQLGQSEVTISQPRGNLVYSTQEAGRCKNKSLCILSNCYFL